MIYLYKTTRRAFSLIEILIALFAVSIAMAAYIPASINSRAQVLHNRHKELAAIVAGTVMDLKREAGYLHVVPGTTPLPAAVTEPDLPNLTGSATVGYLDGNLQPAIVDSGRKRIDVTVSWDDKRKDKGTLTVSSIIAND